MKISVHLEADSPEELRHFFDVFHVKQFEAPEVVRTEIAPLTIKSAELPTTEKIPEIKPVEPVKETPEDISTVDVPAVTEQPVVTPAKRGRKPKAPEPVTEAPAKPRDPALADHVNGVSRKDLLDVFSEYVQRYGANFGYTDVSKLLQQHIGDGVRKASDVPDNALSAAIKAIKAAIIDNPFNRKVDYA